MQTLVLKGEEALKKGAELIRAGEVVAFPTETVYGLGADAFNEVAVRKIFEAKGRPSDNPLIVHIADEKGLEGLVSDVSDSAEAIMKKFMPGPITVIMKKGEKVPLSVTAGLDTVGIRMPSNAVSREFIRECGTPIAAPSANRSTHISPTNAEHVFEDMDGRIPLIIDGGESEVGIESTIVDASTDVPTILRPGAITAEMLAEVLGAVRTFSGKVVVAKAPGMKYKHYAPSCETVVAIGAESATKAYDDAENKGLSPVVIARSSTCAKLGGRTHIDLGESDVEICRNIYAALHRGEKIANFIVCEHFGNEGVCGSVMNRVMKSAGGKTV